MSFDLTSIQSVAEISKSRAKIFTIFGDAGLGKTTLASTFPSPVFIRAEDGLSSLSDKEDIKAFPVVKKSEDILDQARALWKEEHSFKTVILDSITKLDSLIQDEIIKDAGTKNLAQAYGGFGAGYGAVSARHYEIRNKLGFLADKGINIVFIAHSTTKEISLPDEPSFAKYTCEMHEKSLKNYIHDVDVVGFLKLKVVLNKEGKATNTQERELVCHATPSNISKNRLVPPIDKALKIEKGVNPFADYL